MKLNFKKFRKMYFALSVKQRAKIISEIVRIETAGIICSKARANQKMTGNKEIDKLLGLLPYILGATAYRSMGGAKKL